MDNEIPEIKVIPSYKDKVKIFYQQNKILIYFIFIILLISILGTTFYFKQKEKKHLYLSDLYIEAKIDINSNNNEDAKKKLIEIINANNNTYSPLSLFLIIDSNLIKDNKKLIDFFDQITKNNKFEKEILDLINFKKIIVQSDYLNESEFLEVVNPLINSDSIWSAQAMLLLGDYFYSKKDFYKAKESYLRILPVEDNDMLNQQAKNRLLQDFHDK